MKKQELIDLSNWMRGNYAALREIGQALMNTNALRGRQILGIADDLDRRAESVRQKADHKITDVRVAYIEAENFPVAVFPDFKKAGNNAVREAVPCRSLLIGYDNITIRSAQMRPNATENAALDMLKQHLAEIYGTFNLIEVDIHTEEFSK